MEIENEVTISTHNGSQVGHVHIDYIPVGDGFSRGMGT